MPPTIIDIAERAQVNKSTVSRILSNSTHYRYAADTVEKVKQAAAELGYTRNLYAASLKNGRSNVIGFLGENIARNSQAIMVSSRIAAGIERSLPDEKSMVILPSSGKHGIEKSMALVERGMVDGLIIQSFPHHYPRLKDEIIPVLDKKGLPFVVVHVTAENLPCPHVGIDRARTGYLAARDLLAEGIDDIAVFNFWPGNPGAADAFKGVQQAYREAGRTIGPERELKPFAPAPGPWNIAWFEQCMEQIVRPPRALILTNADAGPYAVRAFARRGLRAPEDIIIAGYGQSLADDGTDAPVRLYGVSFEEQGDAAAAMLTDLMQSGRTGSGADMLIMEPRRMKNESERGV